MIGLSAGRLAAAALLVALAACQSTPTSTSGGVPPPANGATSAALEQMKARAQPAPPWMVGKFVGTNLRTGLQNVSIDVDAVGRIKGRVADLTADGQYIGNSRILWAHGNESIVEKRGAGFRVVQVKDPGNVTEYLPR